MVYFLVLVVFVKVLVVFSEIGVVLVVFGSGGSETLNPTLENGHFRLIKNTVLKLMRATMKLVR